MTVDGRAQARTRLKADGLEAQVIGELLEDYGDDALCAWLEALGLPAAAVFPMSQAPEGCPWRHGDEPPHEVMAQTWALVDGFAPDLLDAYTESVMAVAVYLHQGRWHLASAHDTDEGLRLLVGGPPALAEGLPDLVAVLAAIHDGFGPLRSLDAPWVDHCVLPLAQQTDNEGLRVFGRGGDDMSWAVDPARPEVLIEVLPSGIHGEEARLDEGLFELLGHEPGA